VEGSDKFASGFSGRVIAVIAGVDNHAEFSPISVLSLGDYPGLICLLPIVQVSLRLRYGNNG